MKQVFTNSSQQKCVFTDNGVIFCGADTDIFFPFGCIDTIQVSLLGIMQITCPPTICTFAVDRKDRSAIRSLVKQVKSAIPSAPAAELVSVAWAAPDDRLDAGLSDSEKVRRYKAKYIQGAITKAEYDIRKAHLTDNF